MSVLDKTQQVLSHASRFLQLIGPLAALTPAGASAVGVIQLVNAAASYTLMGGRAAKNFQLLNREVQGMVDRNEEPSATRVRHVLDGIERESIEFLGWTPPPESATETTE